MRSMSWQEGCPGLGQLTTDIWPPVPSFNLPLHWKRSGYPKERLSEPLLLQSIVYGNIRDFRSYQAKTAVVTAFLTLICSFQNDPVICIKDSNVISSSRIHWLGGNRGWHVAVGEKFWIFPAPRKQQRTELISKDLHGLHFDLCATRDCIIVT